MSYILDALRRADAQRERDPARGIHAQSGGGAVPESSARGTARPLWWLLALGALVVLAIAAWYLAQPKAERTGQPVSVAAAPAASPPPVPEPPVVIQPPPAAVLMPPPPPQAAPARQPAANRPPAAAPARPPAVARAPAPAPGAPAPSPEGVANAGNATPARGAATPPPAAANAAAPAPSDSAPPQGAAPAAPAQPQATAAPQTPIRSEPPPGAPPLVVTGGVYSNNAAQRMLIVNGQVFSEGGQPAPGVMLEQIRPNSAVLSFGGSRFSVRY